MSPRCCRSSICSTAVQASCPMGRALVRQPRVFLFDEPLSNLDAKLRVEMRAEIKSLHHNTDATIIYVTHDQIEAMTLATKIVVLKEGAIQQVGTPAEIYNRPANLFVADFMGSPAMNMLKGKIVSTSGVRQISIFDGSAVVAIPSSVTTDLVEGREVILGLRPEGITDSGLVDPTADAIARIDADVVLVEPTGSDTFVTARLQGTTFTARVRADVTIAPKERFTFVFNLDKAVVFDPTSGERLL